MSQEPKKIDRRKFIYAGLGAVAVAAIGVAAYFATRPPERVVETVVQTQTVEKERVITQTIEKPVERTIVTTVAGTPTTIKETVKETIVQTVTPTPTPTKKSPYEGETIVVVPHVVPHAYAVYRYRDLFYERTGIKVEVIELAPTVMYERYMSEFIAKTGAFDVIQYNPAWRADFVAGGYLEPLKPLMEKEKLDLALDDIVSTFRELYSSVGGVLYGMPWDGDTHILYYRADLFENPEERDKFKSQYGYDLKPPEDLKQWKEVAQFFTRKKGEKLAGQTLDKDFYGVAEYFQRGRMYWWFLWRFAFLGGNYFDEDMNPLINTKPGIDALTHMVEMLPYEPPGVLNFGWLEVRTAYIQGDVAFVYQWPDVGKTAEDWALSKIVGKTKYALGPRPMIAGGWNLGIPSQSKKKGAAAYFIQFITSPSISLPIVMATDITLDPYRVSHFKSPDFAKAWPRAGEYLAALQRSIERGFPDLLITGSAAYMDALDEECTRALAKEKSPEKALNDAARRWDEITNKLGREQQKKQWRVYLEDMRRLGLVK
ncbi:putative ABC transporter-binding protein [archaeon HR06]|nr:putative ABC transporter-binding protein [archaeon HR06]